MILFTDENIFTVDTPKSQKMTECAHIEQLTKKKDVATKQLTF